MKPRISPVKAVLAVSCLAIAVMAADGSSASASRPACDTVQVAGSSWLGGDGVDVRSNAPDGVPCREFMQYDLYQYGWGRQCVELAQRLYNARGWYAGIFNGVQQARQIYAQAANGQLSGVVAEPAGYVPVPGDLIVEAATSMNTAGHVAIVDRTEGATVHAVEENGADYGRHDYQLAGMNLVLGYGTVIGVVHAVSNHYTNAAAPAPSSHMLGSALVSGTTMYQGDYLLSGDIRTKFVLQSDGNLVVYGPGGRARWSSGTAGQPITRAVMQGDGNLVLYRADNRAAWSTGTAGKVGAGLVIQDDGNVVIYQGSAAVWTAGTVIGSAGMVFAGSDTLAPDGTLSSGRYLRSSDGRFILTMQPDGNLVLYAATWLPLWNSGTAGQPANRLVMQADGNLVIYRPNNVAAWSSGTAGRGRSQLVTQSDGNLVVYDSAGRAAWFSGTAGR